MSKTPIKKGAVLKIGGNPPAFSKLAPAIAAELKKWNLN